MKDQFPRMHSSFYVTSIEKTIQFYNTFFSTEPVKVKPGYVKYVLNEPSLVISFIENPARVQPHFGHMGFQVATEEDLNIRMWQAKKAGIVSKEEKGTNCCYAKQDKFWSTDPDGIQWEVYYFHEDAEFNDPHYEKGTESDQPCCIN